MVWLVALAESLEAGCELCEPSSIESSVPEFSLAFIDASNTVPGDAVTAILIDLVSPIEDSVAIARVWQFEASKKERESG